MKILLLTSEMDEGGVQTHLFDLAVGLHTKGHEVCMASSGGRCADRVSRCGVEHIILPLDKKSPRALWISATKLMRLCKKRRFDIVHAHSRIAAFVASLVCKVLDIRFVTTIHANFRNNFILNRLSRWGDGCIAVSKDLYCYLLDKAHDLSAKNIRLIENGVDVQKFSPKKRIEGSNEKRIVFLSRLDRDCSAGAYALCKTAVDIYRKYPQISIAIGGGGTELEGVRMAAEAANAECGNEAVRVLGTVDNVADLMRSADIFIGVSRAALEAMSCGVPTVLCGDEGFLGVANASTLKIAEHSNLCCRGEKKLTPIALKNALTELLDMSDDKRDQLGKYLRKYVKERHSTLLCTQKVEKFYFDILKKNTAEGSKTLICGYYGFGNLGDELLLRCAAERVKREDGSSCAALVAKKHKSGKNIDFCRIDRSSPKDVIRAINHAQRVVFGGGTLLQNSTSRRSIWYYLFLLKYAQSRGKQTELWGSGIGKIRGRLARRVTARILCRCDKIELRDEISASRARELISSTKLSAPPISVCEDLALSVNISPSACADYMLYRAGIRKNDKIAVIALRGNEKRRYYAVVKRWIGIIVKKGIVPIFVIMYPKQDTAITQKMSRLCGGRILYHTSAEDIFEIMKRAELVCAQRYHALVLSHMAGTSFIGVGGEEKIKSFCGSHGGVYFGDIGI